MNRGLERSERMKHFDPEEYSLNNLNSNDKQLYDCLNSFIDEFLQDSQVVDYLANKDMGTVEKELAKERLAPFLNYLSEKARFHLAEWVISRIESYSNSETTHNNNA